MKTINISDELHATLKERSKWEGMMLMVLIERLLRSALKAEKTKKAIKGR